MGPFSLLCVWGSISCIGTQTDSCLDHLSCVLPTTENQDPMIEFIWRGHWRSVRSPFPPWRHTNRGPTLTPTIGFIACEPFSACVGCTTFTTTTTTNAIDVSGCGEGRGYCGILYSCLFLSPLRLPIAIWQHLSTDSMTLMSALRAGVEMLSPMERTMLGQDRFLDFSPTFWLSCNSFCCQCFFIFSTPPAPLCLFCKVGVPEWNVAR